MSHTTDLEVNCADFLKDNRHLYAHKARRKKIALVMVDLVNRGSAQLRLDLGRRHLSQADESTVWRPRES